MGSRVAVGLVFDASALIDIVDAEPALLTLIAQAIAPVIIATPVLGEVSTLSESDCVALGLIVLEPSLAQLAEASTARGRLSEEDHLCLIVARDLGATPTSLQLAPEELAPLLVGAECPVAGHRLSLRTNGRPAVVVRRRVRVPLPRHHDSDRLCAITDAEKH